MPGPSSVVQAVKDRLRQEQASLLGQRRELPPRELAGRWTAAIDSAVNEIWARALAACSDAPPDRLALVAVGGYGRRDLAPFSDVDVMLLSEARGDAAGALAARLFRDLYDLGMPVGHSVRGVDEALNLARGDATVCTALMETRFLAGHEPLAADFRDRFRALCLRRKASLVDLVDVARRSERIEFGDTVYLLEPSIKRSPGALRDVQFVRWLGFLAEGSPRFEDLEESGLLSSLQVAEVHVAWDFLLRLRIELHAQAGRPGDVLDRKSQVDLADALGYQAKGGLLAVERLMRDYFRRTAKVRAVGQELLEKLRPPRRGTALAGLLWSHQMEGDFRVSPREISLTRRGRRKLENGLVEALRLADLANGLDKRISRDALAALRYAARRYPEEVTSDAAARFLSLLERSARIEELLRTLHELGLLERLIPGFARARGLLQFNEYHKYTVDEHCLRAVGCAADLAQDRGPLGETYRGLRGKRTLHLALLLHDLGKGYGEDHSEVGRRMAEEAAARLGLPGREAETLAFLVHRHLLMSHLAFRRDTSDEQLVLRFAVEVGTPERLQMLYLLTAADLAAVGPGVWTPWKDQVLTDLYRRTLRHLAAGGEIEGPSPRGLPEMESLLLPGDDPRWFAAQWASLGTAYRESTPVEEIVPKLRALRDKPPRASSAEGRYVAERGTVDYTIATDERAAPGIFHRLCGALSGHGLAILSAEINTLADGLVLDRFSTLDPDYSGAPPQSRIDEVCRTLVASLAAPEGPRRVRRTVWRPAAAQNRSLSPLATEVRIDNATSERYTVIDVFAADVPGLLYEIARTLFELELSVGGAKIGTYLDQVVDVFYVTDSAGARIDDESRLESIRTRLLAAVEAAHASQ